MDQSKCEGRPEDIDRAERLRYWNGDYLKYWKARVDEANAKAAAGQLSDLVKSDALTSDDSSVIAAIESLHIEPTHRVLDLGCGFGRSLPYLYKQSPFLTAVDISESMIAASKNAYQDVLSGLELYVCEAEHVPLNDGTIDRILCFGVFDAVYQKETLLEFNRLLSLHGMVLVTGKNSDYFDDDRLALDAEVGARAKRHPNYFTHLRELLPNISAFGLALYEARYYLRRGDVLAQKFVGEMPAQFYEYQVVLRKISDPKEIPGILVSTAFSKTFKRCRREA